MMNKLRLAACGVNCSECGTYNKEHDIKAAESMVEWYRQKGWIEQNEGAEAVQENPPFCKGCWGEKSEIHPEQDCHIRPCCEEKGINHCGDCGVFPCEPYKEWVDNLDHHKKAMEYLLSLKQARK